MSTLQLMILILTILMLSIIYSIILIPYFYYVSDINIKENLEGLKIIWYKLPGLISYEAFKKYEDLFQSVSNGQIKVRRLRIPKNLQQRINWLFRLSDSSAADLWRDDASIEKAVLKIFEDLNQMLEKENPTPKVDELMEFKKEMNNWQK